jgi:DNA (cytosine-5)-methyltransferase 1
MIYGSVCSGIEAASVAWAGLGWECAFVSEIDPFARAVLQHHYSDIPLHGDFTTIEAGDYRPIDLLVGGTPCQSFSVAGLRGGMADDRGNLALEFLRLADRLRPRWLVWENVPGVLSSNGGRDFGAFLGGLGELGYGFAYRVLDAQFFGLAQRRKRVFVVGYFGDWRRAAAVLFERHSLRRDTAPRREAGKDVARTIAGGARKRGGYSADDDIPATASTLTASDGRRSGRPDGGDSRHDRLIAGTLEATAVRAHGGPPQDFESETFVAVSHALRGEGYDGSEDGSGRGTPLVPVAICFSSKDHGADVGDNISPTLRAGEFDGSHANGGVPPAVAISRCGGQPETRPRRDVTGTLAKTAHPPAIAGQTVRRLTPLECCRLQGFPDNYLSVVPYRGKAPPADGPMYKALGNSFAVPVVRKIGERIALVDAMEVMAAFDKAIERAG